MNKAKLKKICVDAFEELEKDALKVTKEYYVKDVATKLYNALGKNSDDEAHNRLKKSLFSLIRESFDELIYPSEYAVLVKQYRKNNLLTQEDFAIQSGIPLRTVQNIEQGKPLYNKTLKKLNNFFEKQNDT